MGYAYERFYVTKIKEFTVSDTNSTGDYASWIPNEAIEIERIDVQATTDIQGANLVVALNDDYSGGSPTEVVTQAFAATTAPESTAGTAQTAGAITFDAGDTVVCAVKTADGTGGAGIVSVMYKERYSA